MIAIKRVTAVIVCLTVICLSSVFVTASVDPSSMLIECGSELFSEEYSQEYCSDSDFEPGSEECSQNHTTAVPEEPESSAFPERETTCAEPESESEDDTQIKQDEETFGPPTEPSAEDDDNMDNLGLNTGGTAQSDGSWKNVNQMSLTFFISQNSVATVSYYASIKKSASMTATVEIEKRVFGIWYSTGIKWTDKASGVYISKSHTAVINDGGTYRAVVTLSFSGGGGEIEKRFIYDESALLGDADGNGRITASDARLALRYSARLNKYNSLDIKRCDVDGDGYITASDARYILRISAHLA